MTQSEARLEDSGRNTKFHCSSASGTPVSKRGKEDGSLESGKGTTSESGITSRDESSPRSFGRDEGYISGVSKKMRVELRELPTAIDYRQRSEPYILPPPPPRLHQSRTLGLTSQEFMLKASKWGCW